MHESAMRVRILMVCMGNICRSPTAHGVFAQMVDRAGLAGQVFVDSAGTHGWHEGAPPDERSQAHAARRGYDLGRLRSRPVRPADFRQFDLLLAMDRQNLAHLHEHCPPGLRARLRLFMDYAPPELGPVVPDPYYGGADGFERVLDLVEAASAGLLDHVRRQLAGSKS